MAKQQSVTYVLTCDVCGNDATESHKVTHGNGTRPAVYEIDVCASDGKKLAKAQEALVALLALGRKAGSGRQRSASTGRPRAKRSAAGDPAAIRAWAKKKGYEVSERGRISVALQEAYAEAR